MRLPAAVLGAALLALTARPAASEVRPGTFRSEALGPRGLVRRGPPALLRRLRRPEVPGRLRAPRPLRGVRLLGATGPRAHPGRAARERRSAGVPRGGGRRGKLVLRERPGRPVRGPGDEGPRRPRRGRLPRRPRPEGARAAGHLDGRIRGPAHRVRATRARRPRWPPTARCCSSASPRPTRAPAAGTWPPSTRSSATRSTPRSGPRTTRSPGRGRWTRSQPPPSTWTAAPRTATGSRAATASCTRSSTSAGSRTAFELPPGDHGYEFVRARLEKSLRFLGDALEAVSASGPAAEPSRLDEISCLESMRRGDPTCLGGFFEAWGDRLYRLSLRLTGIPPRPRTWCRRRSSS